jgi:hypothetical protein
MATARLYELVIGERGALSELLEETEGELTPEIEQLLNELDLKIDQKIENVGLYLIDEQAEVKALKEEEARLAARRKAKERGIDGLKQYAARMLRLAGRDSVKGLRCTVALQKNPPSLKGELDEATLKTLAAADPALVTHVPESYTLNRRAVLDAHKAGKLIPAGLVVEQGESLRVR